MIAKDCIRISEIKGIPVSFWCCAYSKEVSNCGDDCPKYEPKFPATITFKQDK